MTRTCWPSFTFALILQCRLLLTSISTRKLSFPISRKICLYIYFLQWWLGITLGVSLPCCINLNSPLIIHGLTEDLQKQVHVKVPKTVVELLQSMRQLCLDQLLDTGGRNCSNSSQLPKRSYMPNVSSDTGGGVSGSTCFTHNDTSYSQARNLHAHWRRQQNDSNAMSEDNGEKQEN